MGVYKTRTRIYREQSGGNVPGTITFKKPLALNDNIASLNFNTAHFSLTGDDLKILSLDNRQILNKENMINALGTNDLYNAYFKTTNFQVVSNKIALPDKIEEIMSVPNKGVLPEHAIMLEFLNTKESKLFYINASPFNIVGRQWLASDWQTYNLGTSKDSSGYFNYKNGQGGTQLLLLFNQLQQTGEVPFANIQAVWTANADNTKTWFVQFKVNETVNDASYGWGNAITAKWNNLPYVSGQTIENHFNAGIVINQPYGTGSNGVAGIGQVDISFYIVPSLSSNNLYIGLKLSNSLYDHWASGKKINIKIWRLI